MPLARYFLYVGGVLLALVFVADARLPRLPVAVHADAIQPLIRIYSDRGWPERVTYNTGLAVRSRAAAPIAAPYIPAPERAANDPDRRRDAFAAMRPSDTKRVQPVHSVKPHSKPSHPRRIAKTVAAADVRDGATAIRQSCRPDVVNSVVLSLRTMASRTIAATIPQALDQCAHVFDPPL